MEDDFIPSSAQGGRREREEGDGGGGSFHPHLISSRLSLAARRSFKTLHLAAKEDCAAGLALTRPSGAAGVPANAALPPSKQVFSRTTTCFRLPTTINKIRLMATQPVNVPGWLLLKQKDYVTIKTYPRN